MYVFMDYFGLHNVTCKQALYVLSEQYAYMIVLISTDELLCFLHKYRIFNFLIYHM